MDTSKEYILMCAKDVEIQNIISFLWGKTFDGDVVKLSREICERFGR